MKYQPRGTRLLVKKIKDEERTQGGIVLTENTIASRPLKGEIFHKGNECDADFKDNQKILFDRKEYPIIEVEGIEYLLIQQENIIMIL